MSKNLNREKPLKAWKALGLAGLAVLLILLPLILTGCPFHIDSLYGVKATGDGAGGAIALYEDGLGGSIYAQKISPEGQAMWGEKGVLLGSSNSKSYSFFSFNIVSDGSGGAIIAWPDSSQNQYRPTSHLVRLDNKGEKSWQRDFIYFDKLISDGDGGAILAFDYSIGTVYTGNESDLGLVKIDSQGNYPWGLQGVGIPRQRYQSNTLQIVSDGSGGAIVTWEELESQPGPTPGSAKVTNRLFAQRVDSSGKLTWGNNVLLYTTPDGTWFESPQTVSDGDGGVVVSWFQVTEVAPVGTQPRSQIWDIVAQKLDANGNVLWNPGGVPLEISKTSVSAAPGPPVITGDGSGGAIIAWSDFRLHTAGPRSVYAQRIDSNGILKWQAGGIRVSSASLNPRSLIASDGAGSALIVYSFQEDWKILRAQKVNGSGQAVWSTDGVSVTDNGFAGDSISPDGQGGVIIAWGVGRATFSSEKAFVQRVSTEGKLLWGEGIQLNK